MSASDLDTLALLHVAGMLDEEDRQQIDDAIDAGVAEVLDAIDRAEETLAALPLALEPRMPPRAVRQALLDRAKRSVSTDSNPLIRRASSARVLIAAGVAAALALAFWLGVLSESRSGATRDEIVQESAEDWRERALVAEARARSAESARRAIDRSMAELREEMAALETALADLRKQHATIVVVAEEERKKARLAESRVDELASRAAALSEELARLESVASIVPKPSTDPALREVRRALELVRAPDSAMIELVADQQDAPGTASVFWDRGLRYCYLHARNLEPTGGRARRSLWIEYTSGRTVHVTDFDVDASGEAEAFATLPAGLGEIARTFVTRETTSNRRTPGGPIELVERPPDPTADAAVPPSARRYRRRF